MGASPTLTRTLSLTTLTHTDTLTQTHTHTFTLTLTLTLILTYSIIDVASTRPRKWCEFAAENGAEAMGVDDLEPPLAPHSLDDTCEGERQLCSARPMVEVDEARAEGMLAGVGEWVSG